MSAPTTIPRIAIQMEDIRFILIYLFNFDSSLAEQVNSVREAIFILIDDSFYAGLDDQFRAFDARGGRHVEGRPEAAVA